MSTLPKIAAGEAKLTDHSGQETGGDFLAEVFDDGLACAVVERDVAPFTAFGFHPNGHGTRYAQLAHPLNEFPPFDPATIGQECPNSNGDLVIRPAERVQRYPPDNPNSALTLGSGLGQGHAFKPHGPILPPCHRVSATQIFEMGK